jgi:NADH-quinone oxidoreductase subunit M
MGPLSLLMLAPLAAIVVILVIPGDRPRAVKIVSAVAALVTCLVAGFIWVTFDFGGARFQFEEDHLWIPGLNVRYHLGVDGHGIAMVALTAIVFFTGVLSMWELKERVKEYFAFMLLLVIGVFGVFTSLDLFAFFFFYEIAVLPMYPLIAIWGSTRKEYAAMKLTLMLLAGSALLFPGLILLWANAGATSWDIPVLMAHTFSTSEQVFIYPFLYLGFGVLAGMFPLHGWSPTGHVAAPTAVSMLHAGVLMKLGAFGILAIGVRLLPEGAYAWAWPFAVLAAIGVIYGAFVALRQTDFKFVIGFSSVSHMGIVLLGLNLGVLANGNGAGAIATDAINGAVFQMFAHGIMTALLFSSVGFLYERTHSKTIADFGGLSKQLPVAVSFFIIAGLCGVGVPGLASFWAELLVFMAAFRTNPLLGAIVIGGLVITLAYMLRVFKTAFFGPRNPRWDHLTDVTPFLATPRVILIVVLLVFGFAPRLLLDLLDTATLTLFGHR